MKKNILSLAALLIASATFVACSSDDNSIIDEQPVNTTGKYTMTVNATKGGDEAVTRALELDGKTLNAYWYKSEKVKVYNSAGIEIGELSPTTSGEASTTLKGDLKTLPTNGTALTLKFLSPDNYAEQNGTLEYIANNCDYATATVTAKVNGTEVTTTAPANFENKQAIVKFILKSGSNGIKTSLLKVYDGTNLYTVTPKPTDSTPKEFYVALRGFSNEKVELIATGKVEYGVDEFTEDTHYTYEKSGVTFENGKYYEITVDMWRAPNLELKNAAVGDVIGSKGYIYKVRYDDGKVSMLDGESAIAMIAYLDGNQGLAVALKDESGTMDLATAKTKAAMKPALSGGSWRVGYASDWRLIFSNGNSYGENYNYNDLNTKLAHCFYSEALTIGDNYWTNPSYNDYDYFRLDSNSHSVGFYSSQSIPVYSCKVRACFFFKVQSGSES